MRDMNTYHLKFPCPINGAPHWIENVQTEREQAQCMVFLQKSGLGIPTEQFS